MARGTIVAACAVLLLASSAQATGVLCKAFFTGRQIAIANEQWNSANDYSALIKLFDCCDRNAEKCNKKSGTVCGVDWKNYGNECLACATGIRFNGACNPPPLVFECYNVPVVDQASLMQRVGCFSIDLTTIVNSVNLSILQPDMTLPDPNRLPILGLGCTGDRSRFRTVDGACNSPVLTYSGMVGLKFTRHDKGYNLPADVDAAIANGPNPRLVSNLLFRRDTFKPNRANLNALSFAWLNFFIHDFFLHDNDWQNPIAIPLPRNDPDFPAPNSFTDYYMYIPRSAIAADATPSANFLRNQATAWFDGSQVYSSDAATLASIRDPVNPGRMLLAGGLPPNKAKMTYRESRSTAPPLFHFGDPRGNQHVGLQAIQTLFLLEHNNIVAQLAAAYPALTSDELFGFARNILAAELYKIQTVEMSVQLVDDPAQQAIIASVFSAGHTRAYNPLATHITPEDFISAYRWHAMVPATLQLRDNNRAPIGAPVEYFSTFHDTSVLRANGVGPVLVGLGMQPAGWLTLNNHPDGIRRLNHPSLIYDRSSPFADKECQVVPLFDLGTLDVVRDRERAVPRIGNYWRRLGLPQYAPTMWMHLANTASQAAVLADLYDNNIENVDFVVGMLGGNSIPADGLPEVSTAGFIPFVISRAYTDRFFTSAGFIVDNYTQLGLARIFGAGTVPGVSMSQIMVETGVVAANTIPNPAKVFKVWA